MHSSDKIKFSTLEDSTSLESFILSFFDISKSKLKKMNISKNYLQKNILKGDLIELDINIVNHNKIRPNPLVKVKIIDENVSIVAISKPYNMHTHPLSYNEIDNVLSCLFMEHSYLEIVNVKSYDRGLLYRLDYETSGLLLYAKEEKTFLKYRKCFNQLIKSKVYLAIVSGHIKNSIELSDFIYSSEKKGSKMKVGKSESSKLASIKIEPVSFNLIENVTLIKVFLNEGHRHQIRVQLANNGNPILGDTLYSGKNSDRVFLHCYQYEIENKLFTDNNLELFNLFFNLDGKF